MRASRNGARAPSVKTRKSLPGEFSESAAYRGRVTSARLRGKPRSARRTAAGSIVEKWVLGGREVSPSRADGERSSGAAGDPCARQRPVRIRTPPEGWRRKRCPPAKRCPPRSLAQGGAPLTETLVLA